MTERTFTYTWSDAKRLTVLHALGFMLVRLETDKTPPAVSQTVLEIIGELSRTTGQDSPGASPTGGAAAAHAVLAPPAPHDYFAANKKGDVPMTPPDGAELSNVKIVSAQQLRGKEYLTVIFQAGITLDGKARPAGKANCFDKGLWSAIKNRENQIASLWIMESGNYLNIVGVRA
jgi:hypothetical protein